MNEPPPPDRSLRRSLAERLPNAYVLIFGLLLVAAALTWVIPAGQFARAEREGRTVVVPGTFQRLAPDEPLPPGNVVRPEPQGIGAVLRAPIRGFVAASEIIVFILVVGGAFKIMEATGAVWAGISRVVYVFRGRELLLVPIVMVLFSLGGAIFGMSEETIPFVMLFVPLALALGYDTVTGVSMPFLAAGAGFAAAFINPFTLGIAQGIAELPPISGFGYRVLAWTIITAVTIAFVMRHALRVRRDPTLSPTYQQDQLRREAEGLAGGAADATWAALEEPMTRRQQLVLAIFVAAMALLVVGVLAWGWYIEEIAALFLGFGIVAALVSRLGGEGTVTAFLKGAGELLGAALIVGLARGVLVIAENGGIIDPTLHALSTAIGQLPPVMSAQLMFLVQTVLNLIVPSGSGQAALTMPLMAPLSDLVGVTRQTAVLAFQFGDGFSNLIIPTSGVLLGVLGVARVAWPVWARWVLPLQGIFLVLGLLLLIPPVLMSWGPY